MKRILLATFVFAYMLSGCKNNNDSTLATFKMDNLEYVINSAGVAYDVTKDNKLDSSSGLKYMIEMTIINHGRNEVHFNRSSFKLFDSEGKQMPFPIDGEEVFAAVNAFTVETVAMPEKKTECTLLFLVDQPGVYKLEVTSPTTGEKSMIELPAS